MTVYRSHSPLNATCAATNLLFV